MSKNKQQSIIIMRKLLFLFTVLAFISCDKNDIDIPVDPDFVSKTIEYKKVDGVDKNLLSLDIYYDNNFTEKSPVIVYVHGGGWAIGDKTNKLTKKIEMCRDSGYVLVSVNYRLSPFPYELDNPGRIKFPVHPQDVADAVKYIYDNIGDFGGDRDNMLIMGHSAGAHIVSLICTDNTYLNSVGLSAKIFKGIISLDSAGFDVERAINNTTPGSLSYQMYINAFGDDSQIWHNASPAYHVSDDNCDKWLIIYRGTSKRVAIQTDFIASLRSIGISVEELFAVDYSHSGVNDAIGDKDDTVINPVVQEFIKYVF